MTFSEDGDGDEDGFLLHATRKAPEEDTGVEPAPKRARATPPAKPAAPDACLPFASVEEPAPRPEGASPFAPSEDRGPRVLPVAEATTTPDGKEQEEASTSPNIVISRPSPTTWLERLSPSFLSDDANCAALDRNIEASLAESQAETAIRIERSPEFAILSIASGSKNKTILIHNLTGLADEVQGEDSHVALLGFGRIANLFAVSLRKALGKRHGVKLPTAAAILRLPHGSQIPEVNPDGEENCQPSSTVSSLQLPPWLTEETVKKKLSKASDVLLAARTEILCEIAEQASLNNVSPAAKLTELEEENSIPWGTLLRHLHDFATLPKAIPS